MSMQSILKSYTLCSSEVLLSLALFIFDKQFCQLCEPCPGSARSDLSANMVNNSSKFGPKDRPPKADEKRKGARGHPIEEIQAITARSKLKVDRKRKKVAKQNCWSNTTRALRKSCWRRCRHYRFSRKRSRKAPSLRKFVLKELKGRKPYGVHLADNDKKAKAKEKAKYDKEAKAKEQQASEKAKNEYDVKKTLLDESGGAPMMPANVSNLEQALREG